ncbi:uncharacterized protein LOC134244417 [Saccostrea cucullata]|uniref:uncharacterized protein LOC134244417 n=1 Tax=Saccostrea cuccullata TaxID=36930 RepID=UPI002ED496EF
MHFKQANPMKKSSKYRLYSPTSLTNAYLSIKTDKKSVMGAARQYNVPITTLRDRVLGNVDPETVKSGRSPLLDTLQESNIVEHLKVMAEYGYGYTRQEVVDLASDYAVQNGIRDKQHPFSLKWFRGFVSRWPELKVLKPRSLEIVRAKCASVPVVDRYFKELEQVIRENSFDKNPYLIYNVDEKGFTQNHTPPFVVCGNQFPPQAVTAGKSSTTTVIGCGSASGTAIPPFFIFAGKRMMPELMEGATPGAVGRVSETGWSNSQLFREFLEDHFLKHVPIKDGQKVLLLMDGHKSHTSVGLVQWARDRNIILFILPAHTSHILQPLDVGCYGPMQKMYNSECHKFTRESHTVVTRYNICHIVCKVYSKAMSAENLIAAFRKTGIYPCSRAVIPPDSLKPAEIFIMENEISDSSKDETAVEKSREKNDDTTFFEAKVTACRNAKREGVAEKKERKTMSKIISGHCLTDNIIDQMVQLEDEQNGKGKGKRKTSDEDQGAAASGSGSKKQKKTRLPVVEDSDTEEEEVVLEKDLCCVCKKFTPEEIRKSDMLIFTKWAQCDGMRNGMPCKHWTHLRYCCSTRVVRLHDKFLCPHCIEE